MWSPDIHLHNIEKLLMAQSSKLVYAMRRSVSFNSPFKYVSELEFSTLRICVFAVGIQMDNVWHESAPLSENLEMLHVSLRHVSAGNYTH